MEPLPLPRDWDVIAAIATEWVELQALLPRWTATVQAGRAGHPQQSRLQYRLLLEREQQLRGALGPPPAVSRAAQWQMLAWLRLL